MTEFWVCEGCKSLVRGNVDTCYRCRSRRPTDARELGIGARGAVLTPGIDQDLQHVGFLLADGRHVLPTRPLAILVILGSLGVLAASVAGAVLLVYLGVAVVQLRADVLLDPGFYRLTTQVDLVRSVLLLVSGGLWLVFLAISVHNAPLLGAGTPPSSWMGAVLWWFVPIVNLVRPATIVADLHARLASKGSGGQLMVGLWWAGFMVSYFLVPFVLVVAGVSAVGLGIAGMAGAPVSMAPTFAGVTIGTTAITLLDQLLYIGSGVAFILVVAQIDARQATRRAWIAAGREQFAAASRGAA